MEKRALTAKKVGCREEAEKWGEDPCKWGGSGTAEVCRL